LAKAFRHPHPGAGATEVADGLRTTGTSRWQKVVGVIGLVVVLWVGRDLYDVVTSGGERPSGGRPPAGDPAPPAGDPAPPAGDAHDPSQFRH